MPIVRIELLEGRTAEQKETLIHNITKTVCDTLEVTPERVRVLLFEVPPSHWGVAGTPMSRRP
ncbi:MAG: 4-oxalocrotonate tautomerase [Deltaproteobacteria bacterium]|nr:4-oxalocrotonate tautomerase [Deltaproteobacteria bacterium]MBI3077233.1 4-oxalocrotonate tautomerase [Deltaproteobacteria bacterium]